MKSEEIKDKSVQELTTMLDELTKEQIGMRIQRSVGQQVARHRFKIVRRNIARVKMHMHMQNSQL